MYNSYEKGAFKETVRGVLYLEAKNYCFYANEKGILKEKIGGVLYLEAKNYCFYEKGMLKKLCHLFIGVLYLEALSTLYQGSIVHITSSRWLDSPRVWRFGGGVEVLRVEGTRSYTTLLISTILSLSGSVCTQPIPLACSVPLRGWLLKKSAAALKPMAASSDHCMSSQE